MSLIYVFNLFPMYTLIFFSDCLGQVSYSCVTVAVWHLFTSFHTNVKAWGSFLWWSLFGLPHIYVFWQISSPLIGFSLESNAPATDPSSIVSLTGGDFCFMMKYKWISFCFMMHKYITFSFKLVFSKGYMQNKCPQWNIVGDNRQHKGAHRCYWSTDGCAWWHHYKVMLMDHFIVSTA